MKSIFLFFSIIYVSSYSYADPGNLSDVKKCENGDVSRSMCIDLISQLFEQAKAPTLNRDKVPMKCYVLSSSILGHNQIDQVISKFGKVFDATFHIKTFSAQAADRVSSKTVGYITYGEHGGLTNESLLSGTKIEQDETSIRFFRNQSWYEDMVNHDALANVTNWVSEYKGQLLVAETYYEHIYFPLNRQIRCIEKVTKNE